MNRFTLLAVLVLSAIFIYTSCDKEKAELFESPYIKGLTINNYPKIDGSTSAMPLNTIIACKLLGIDYEWVPQGYEATQGVEPNISGKNSEKFWNLIKSSATHQSYINLIDKEADLILNARKMSSDEKAYADAAGVSLIETPIALDAFVFIVHSSNTINSLTTKQIQDIYTGKITKWNEVEGNSATIKPYVRNANSGSQELMETLVMKDLDMSKFPVAPFELVVVGMFPIIDSVAQNVNSICYTVYYYKEQIVTYDVKVKTIAVDGIHPNKETISNNSYPYVAEVYAVIRSDLDKSSMAYKVYEWLQTGAGKAAISESGYIPN
jgi:phosphate transport system substrate-binding protein